MPSYEMGSNELRELERQEQVKEISKAVADELIKKLKEQNCVITKENYEKILNERIGK